MLAASLTSWQRYGHWREGERGRERERERARGQKISFFSRHSSIPTHEMVFFSVVLDSGLALFSTFKSAEVLALILEWR